MNSEPANPLWLLFGDTGRELSCDISRMPSGHWAVTLSLGSERMLSEEFCELQTAMDGAARAADRVEVRWPNGLEEVWTDVKADQMLTLREGGGTGR